MKEQEYVDFHSKIVGEIVAPTSQIDWIFSFVISRHISEDKKIQKELNHIFLDLNFNICKKIALPLIKEIKSPAFDSKTAFFNKIKELRDIRNNLAHCCCIMPSNIEQIISTADITHLNVKSFNRNDRKIIDYTYLLGENHEKHKENKAQLIYIMMELEKLLQ